METRQNASTQSSVIMLTSISMKWIKSVAVFCASSDPVDNTFIEEASRLGKRLADEHLELVYGGGNRGMMGAVAESCHNSGGTVTGVLPEIFNRPDVLFKDSHSRLIIVPDMHERKEKMYSLSDAFIILPGGIGTLEEFFEIYTWKQIGLHRKNIALYNIKGFYDTLLSFLDDAVGAGLVSRQVRESLIVAQDIDTLLAMLDRKPEALPDKIGHKA